MKRKIQLIHLLLATLIFFVTLEAGLRLSGVKPGVYISHRLTPYQFDPVFGWITRSNSSYLRVSPEYIHYNYYNPQGFPTDSKNREKIIDKKLPKIALIGDSYVEGYYTPYEKSFPYLMNKQLRGKEILNLGVSGYDPGQYLLQARKFIPQFNVEKIVIFFSPASDIRDLHKQALLGVFNKPVFGNDLGQPINLPLIKAEEKKDRLEDYFATLTVLQPVMSKWFGHINYHFRYNVSKRKLTYTYPSMVDALMYLKKMQQEFGYINSISVVYIPSDNEYNFNVTTTNFNTFIKACNELQIKCVIPDFFQNANENYKDLYLLQDHHISELGSKKMADFLINFLSK